MRLTMNAKKTNTYTRFALYFIVVILINAVGMNLFFRVDLTSSGIYSISEISKEAVSSLSEPLTAHVFFSENLPAPHNSTERYLRDLLKEYGISGNRFFNYRFHNIKQSSSTGGETPESYGIYPVQLQYLKNDEIKLLKAYMGMVLIHGDMMEKIPSITSTEGLEYRITTAIQKMNNKVSALLRLKSPIHVKLVLSSSLQVVAPYVKLPKLMELPETLKKLSEEIAAAHYGKLEFSYIDPTRQPELAESLKKYRLLELSWPELKDAFGKMIPAGKGIAGLIIEHENDYQEFQLIEALNIPLIGTQYRLVKEEQTRAFIEEGLESLLDINMDLGYLADHGTLTLYNPMVAMQRMTDPNTITNFNTLVGKNYSFKQVNLAKDGLTGEFNTLVIAGPKEPFSEYELFKIDQFLMQGKNLALFLDPFREVIAQQGNMQFMNRNQGPTYLPLDTGLEKLLDHYGVSLKKAYVMDEKCFTRTIDAQYGGGEQTFYFAPEIQQENINRDLPFMRNLNRIVLLKTAPLEIKGEKLKAAGILATQIFASSKKAWEMKGRISLNPYMIHKPQTPEGFSQFPLALMLEGEFPSYFAEKGIPEKEEKKEAETGKTPDKKGILPADQSLVDMSRIESRGELITKGKPGKIFIVGTSDILKNNVIDLQGQGQNAIFVLNLLDHLNHRDGIALMRSKQQTVSLLDENRTGEGRKSFVKAFNIIGLPLLVILGGVGFWMKRRKRSRSIQRSFNPQAKGDNQ